MKNLTKKIVILLLSIVFSLNVVFYFSRIRPTVKEYCSLEVQSVIRNVINNANEVVLAKNVTYDTLFTVRYNDTKDVCFVSGNSGLINQISMLWATEIQKGIDQKKAVIIKRPIGAFTGNAFLGKYGRELELEINYSATSRTEYRSVFIEKGVNQTLHKLFLTAYVEAVIITPLKTDSVIVDETFLFSEAILNGKVPETYISANNYQDYLDLLE